MNEFKKVQSLLKSLIRLTYVQHQTLIWGLAPEQYGLWLNRFVLGFQMQKQNKIWDDEEWPLILLDVRDAFQYLPQLQLTWKRIRKYYPKDAQKFIDDAIASACKQPKNSSPTKVGRKRKN
ncbi:hypothetical protein A2662_03835 [Candidatus Giovannonibacteria bacterium RIFCSPHIGHO2_01_FULL_45_33]|uniref:Uncharacterized protein n=1 Tax=Candidatus Giovannonibacteria bacterium RIFCSPLOWO2_01_FULL_45_34 TaxID=1798351 RepID=A0A1F5X050_9BACT|nr:MAG: hypothetical protein A2662_03835 [Candidatus Giovannonibacteria bacterium RIFCSPHIGHO2_01_FULL_45_33]OGF81233.1 MAG: hypothetical protein A2930_02100 [Candidatus Giovannonibacteria bacterium RIFCSPLOWO2_01_FULL_45_34]